MANEAIHPFYLLHQPAIVVFGYYITRWDISPAGKAGLIAGLSLAASLTVYWFLIRPYDPLRVLFGMKKKRMRAYTPTPPCRPATGEVALGEPGYSTTRVSTV